MMRFHIIYTSGLALKDMTVLKTNGARR